MIKLKEVADQIVAGGEMGKLIREFDWATTELGPPEAWPPSLRTIVNILLNSSFPKFLFWGPNNICFYNDAYRPSLGISGKHPSILGTAAKEAWPEIWDTISVLIDDVYEGRRVWMEDELIPIYRNGQIEDVYWTFSYSPTFDDHGVKSGVLVTCMEMTRAVKSVAIIQKQAEELKQKEDQLREITSVSPAGLWMTDENAQVTYVNQTWINWTGRAFKDHLGNGWAESIYEEDVDYSYNAYMKSFEARIPFNFDFRLKMSDGSLRWTGAQGDPIYAGDGSFRGFAGSCLDITDRKKNEEISKSSLLNLENLVAERTLELRKRESQLSEAQEIAKMASWEWDFKEEKIIWTPEMYRFWGYEPGEIDVTLDYVAHNTYKDDLHILQSAIEDVTQGKEVELEYRRFNKQGELIYISTKTKVIRNEDQKPIGAFGIDLNITQSKEKDLALYESEQLNRSILEILPDIVVIYDLEKKDFVFSNRNIMSLLGYDVQPSSSSSFRELLKRIHPEDSRKLQLYLDSFLHKSNENVEEIEYRCQSRNGDFIHIKSRDTIYKRNKDGVVIQVIGVLSDVSAAKKSAFQMESMNELLLDKNKSLEHQLLVDFSESFASYKTGDDLFHSLSEEIAEKAQLDYVLFGKLVPQADGTKVIESFSARHKGKLIDKLVYPLPDGPCEQVIKGVLYTYPKDCQLTFPNNKTIKDLNVEGYIGYPLFDDKNEAIGLINVMHGASIDNVPYLESLLMIAAKRVENELMRLRNEEEMQRKNVRLELQNNDLTSFNHAVSHDLQEPIRKILMFISRMQDTDLTGLSERFMGYLDRVQVSAHRMQVLIQDLLVFSSINEVGGFFEDVDLTSSMKTTIADLSERIKETKASITYDDLPVIRAIPLQIDQLFNNIVANSIKYARKDVAPVINITSEVLSPGKFEKVILPDNKTQYIKIEVKDNGIGFKQKYATTLFRPFKRLHNKDEYPGSGIGLAICQKIIQNHKGVIIAEGKDGAGATFTLYIPV